MGLMTGLAIGSAAIGAAGGISKMIGGGKQKRAAKRAIRQFKRQELKNINEGRGIATRGAEAALEANARQAATAMETLASGGIRGVVGGVGAVQEQTNKVAQQVGAGIEQQEVALERDFAQDEARIRAIKEQRDNQELNQMYAQLNAGQQNQASGLGDIAQAGFGAASMVAGAGAGKAAGGVGQVAKQTVGQPNAFDVAFQAGRIGQDYTKAIPAFGQPAGSFSGQYVNNPSTYGAIDPLTGQPY